MDGSRLIVTAWAPRDIRRDNRFTATSSSEFVRAWWCGVRGFQPTGALPATYQAGFGAGLAWRDFYGPERVPHDGHATDALQLFLR